MPSPFKVAMEEEIMELRDLLKEALAESTCYGSSGYPVPAIANDCTEGKCWHARAKKLLEEKK